MKIGLLGYGKMGKTIEQIAVDRGHDIVLKVNSSTKSYTIEDCDVAIDFSLPETAVANISECLEAGVPVISGTTGWLDHYSEITALCKKHDGTFLYASNFSLGVNVFFELNKTLARLMGKLPEYNAHIEEIHHTQKLDAPSGTAITLAAGIIDHSSFESWSLNASQHKELPITAKRVDNVPGTHTISYTSEIDSIEIKHTAHSRQGFALGAVVAAEYIKDKKGVFTMKDVLNIS
ncbi:4-hydroxy-tetrahydrodipicolinate reductase [Sediminibacter sp. Hel_I_10]|uniref:4-hydroxy-tetrahydrodipicolinate reductase n=1 Tax=Sediminibacter sp. Hel_I_10 TaxID=1392490 RepID=UPI00047BAAC1|nr:4-hydroxy-tetrahydrodipicolinate reductase [Sediminibacter sp. Hel_I_10]